MIRLGAATGGIGFFALALDAAFNLWLASAACFCQGFCGGAIDAIANAAVSAVHGTDVAPWMQGLHFSFSAGALCAPAAVGQVGYRVVFLAFGLLAQPVGLACCLSSGAAAVAAAEITEGAREDQLLVDDAEELPVSMVDDIDGCGGGGGGGGGSNVVHADDVTVTTRLVLGGDVEMVQGEPKLILCSAKRQGKEPLANLLATANGRAVPVFRRSLPEVAEGDRTRQSQTLSAATDKATKKPDLNSVEAADEVLMEEHRYRQPDESVENPLHARERAEEAALKPPTVPLIGLLVLFFFLYVGIEVGFGAWIDVVVLTDDLAAETGAALMASLFWGGITVGRLVAIPLSVRFSVGFLVKVNLAGGLLSSTLLWSIGRDGIAYAAIGAVLFGLFMASTYPLAMSLLPSAGYFLSDKDSSRFVVGGALGEMLVPAFIALFLGSGGSNTDSNSDDDDDHESGRPGSLYSACLAVSALLVAVYSKWCSMLASPTTLS
ncbi:unnamed protein product [Hapterophycus canaliculatus]